MDEDDFPKKEFGEEVVVLNHVSKGSTLEREGEKRKLTGDFFFLLWFVFRVQHSRKRRRSSRTRRYSLGS
jgi:hypothetical protein